MALFSVFPKMTAIFMLLMLIFYIFAIMFTQLFKSLFEDQLVRQPYFDTIYFSMFTLFQMMTLVSGARPNARAEFEGRLGARKVEASGL